MKKKVSRRLAATVAAGVLLLLGAAASFLTVPHVSTVQEAATGNVGEIYGAREVGQTFESLRPRLRAVAFQVATYSGRENTEDVIFELRKKPEDFKPIRTVRVNARRFKDHQRFAFNFSPLSDSRGKTYYASLRSPTSRPWNAITVDVSNRNPYKKAGPSSLLVFRRTERSGVDIAASTKRESDLAFSVIHDIAFGERLRVAARAGATAVFQNPERWRLDGKLAVVALLLAGTTLGSAFLLGMHVRPGLLHLALGGFLVLGFCLRLLFANRLPYTNDEGTALYDAWTLLQGRLPGGDGVLKTPVTLGILAGALSVLGPTLIAGRLVSILAGLLTVFPLMSLTRRLGGATAALAAGAFWLLAAAPAVFGIYTHAQSVQLLLATLGLAVFARVLRAGEEVFRGGRERPFVFYSRAILAGALFALALGARKTSLAAALPAAALLFGAPVPWRAKARAFLTTLVGFVLVFGILVSLEYSFYGGLGVRYFLGIDVANIDPATTGSLEERQSAFIKGVTPFFREGLPLIFWALLGIGGGLETLARRLSRSISGRKLPVLGLWLVPLALAWYGGSFLQAHEGSEHFAFGLWPFWVTMSSAVFVTALLPGQRETFGEESERGNGEPVTRALRAALPLLVPATWLLGTTLVYASWIKFTANYLAEFIPAVTLLAACGIAWFLRAFRKRPKILLLAGALTTWGAFSAARIGVTYPHTGTFDLSSIKEAARYLEQNVPREEPVLTAAVAIPLLSGHQVPFDIAHPTHYAYGFIEPSVRNIYMAPAETMVQAVRENVRWLVHEKLTDFSYFKEYPDIRRLIEEEFEQVAEFENLSNPITILRRRAEKRK